MNKIALVTGSNSGLGLETSRLLGLREDYSTIYLAVRSKEKGLIAKRQLVEEYKVSEEKLKVFVVNVSSIESTTYNTNKFMESNPGLKIDALILNAGRVGGKKLEKTLEGNDVVYAASLLGHHIMAIKFLKNSFMAENSTIVLAGSELSRGKVTGVNPKTINVKKLALKKFDGDLVKTLTHMIKGEQKKYDGMGAYSDTKKLSNWWAAALEQRIQGKNVSVLCVSPGNTPYTNAMRHLGGLQSMMLPLMIKMMKLFGMSHSLEKGALRYIDALDFDKSHSGKFYASPKNKVIGELTDNTECYPIFADKELQQATLDVLSEMTGEEF